MKRALTRIVNWGHELLEEIISPGNLVVDLTAGNGYDTLRLFQLAGAKGQVVAFDIQGQALENTAVKLAAAGAEVFPIENPGFLGSGPGVYLVAGCHSELDKYLDRPLQAVIANLGYLPGGNQQLITRPDSTLLAMEQATDLLAVGGRLAVVVYSGHPGGQEEANSVDRFFASLPEHEFGALRLQVENRPQAPYLLVAEKCEVN